MKVQSNSKYTAIFGGAFDPFHNGHIAAIALLLTEPQIERVIVAPSGERPDKKSVSAAADRYEMTRLGVESAFPGEPRVSVTDVQSRGGVGFSTIDLVMYARNHFGGEVGVVIGHDLLKDLPHWHRADELKQIATFLVFQRPGVAIDQPPPGWRVEFLAQFGDKGVEVSSTALRSRIASGDRCEGLIPRQVSEYCTERGLYRI